MQTVYNDDDTHTTAPEVNPLNETNGTKSEQVHKSNPLSALVNILKTFAGAGSFALPWALKQAGVVTGIIGIILVAILSNYTMQLLVKCRRYIQREGEYRDSDYWQIRKLRQHIDTTNQGTDNEEFIYPKRKEPALIEESSSSDPNDYIYDKERIFTYVDLGYEAMGNFGTWLVYILITTCNMGVCTVYLVFIGKLMNSMVPQVDLRLWMLLAMPVLMPLSWIRTYKFMSPISFFGVISLLTALGSVIVYGFMEKVHEMRWPWQYGSYSWINFGTLPLFIGIALFLFNTHTMVLPIEQSMKNRRWYGWTLTVGFIFIALVNMFFAILCFSFFGVEVQDDVTKNLPENSAWVLVIKSLLCAELALTYGVVLMPISELVVDQKILSKVSPTAWNGWFFSLLGTGARSILVLITLVVAEIFGSRFALVMSFIGGVSPNALGFICPSLFYLIIMRRKYGFIPFMINCLIILVGFTAMFWNSYTVIQELVTQIQNGTF